MINVATVFSGIGAPEFALKRLGIQHRIVLACDNGDTELKTTKEQIGSFREKAFSFKTFQEEKAYVDELYCTYNRKHNFVKDTYLANYGLDTESVFFQDIFLLNGKPLAGNVDLLVGGSPCQSFSSVGAQKGFDDFRGTLFFEFVRLVEEIEPRYFIYENVNALRSNKNKEIWARMLERFEKTGYTIAPFSLNALDYGIPQVRNRVFVVGFKNEADFRKFERPETFSKDRNKLPKMQDFLLTRCKEGSCIYGDNGDLVLKPSKGHVSDKYILSAAVKKYVLTPGTKNWKTKIQTDRPIARTLLSTMGNHHRAGVDNYVTENGKLRSLTERECARLMGFSDDFLLPCSKAQSYKQVGNSMVVDVVMAILKGIKF